MFGIKKIRKAIITDISTSKGDLLKAEKEDGRRKKFFEWFEEQFFADYTASYKAGGRG